MKTKKSNLMENKYYSQYMAKLQINLVTLWKVLWLVWLEVNRQEKVISMECLKFPVFSLIFKKPLKYFSKIDFGW